MFDISISYLAVDAAALEDTATATHTNSPHGSSFLKVTDYMYLGKSSWSGDGARRRKVSVPMAMRGVEGITKPVFLTQINYESITAVHPVTMWLEGVCSGYDPADGSKVVKTLASLGEVSRGSDNNIQETKAWFFVIQNTATSAPAGAQDDIQTCKGLTPMSPSDAVLPVSLSPVSESPLMVTSRIGVEIIDIETALLGTSYSLYVTNYGEDAALTDSNALVTVLTSDGGVVDRYSLPPRRSEDTISLTSDTCDCNSTTPCKSHALGGACLEAVPMYVGRSVCPPASSNCSALSSGNNYNPSQHSARVFCMRPDGITKKMTITPTGRYFTKWGAFNAKKSLSCPSVDDSCVGRDQGGTYCSANLPGSYFTCPGAYATMKTCPKDTACFANALAGTTIPGVNADTVSPSPSVVCMDNSTCPSAITRTTSCSGSLPLIGDSGCTPDKKCHFPFTYAGSTYCDCTSDGYHTPWCYQEEEGLDSDGVTVKQQSKSWGVCGGANTGPSQPVDNVQVPSCTFP